MKKATARKVLATFGKLIVPERFVFLTLYADGSLVVERKSRWLGDRDGIRWRSEPGLFDLLDGASEQELEERLKTWYGSGETLESYLCGSPSFRITSRGRLVK